MYEMYLNTVWNPILGPYFCQYYIDITHFSMFLNFASPIVHYVTMSLHAIRAVANIIIYVSHCYILASFCQYNFLNCYTWVEVHM